jgi:hypothetical protein
VAASGDDLCPKAHRKNVAVVKNWEGRRFSGIGRCAALERARHKGTQNPLQLAQEKTEVVAGGEHGLDAAAMPSLR